MTGNIALWERFGARLAGICGTVVIGSALLAGCGGGGTSSPPPTTLPPTDALSFGLVGPADTAATRFLCGSADGEATSARYLNADRGGTSPIQLAALPDGGLIGRTASSTGTGATRVDFLIDAQGRRSTYTARAVDSLRVDTEGKLWWIDANQILWRGSVQPDGRDERIGQATAYTGTAADGAADQVALGSVKGFAATPQAIYLLVQDSSGSKWAVRRLRKDAATGWQVSTIAISDTMAGAGYEVRLLTNRQGAVALVTTSPTTAPPELFNTPSVRNITATFWQLQGGAIWQSMATKSYTISSTGYYGSNSLELESVTLNDRGNLVWGGGGAARLYEMGQDGSWRFVAGPSSTNGLGVGLNGDVSQATFLSAYSLLTASDGSTVFYDGITCQVRRLSNQALSTLSGPVYTTRTHVANARLLGFDSNGALVFAHDGDVTGPSTPRTASIELSSGRFTTLDEAGLLQTQGTVYAPNGDGCDWGGTRGRACATYRWELPTLPLGTVVSLDRTADMLYARIGTQLYRRDATGYQAITTNPALAFYGASDFPYWMGRTDEAAYQPILYRFNPANATSQAIAGPTIDTSPLYPGKRTLLNNLEVAFVQVRSDSGFWMSSNRVIGRITSAGDYVGVAGNYLGTPQSRDGLGAAAQFTNIKRLRTLSDNRLLVLDDNAVRLVDDGGAVRTLFTLASSGIAGSNVVDMMPRGRDVYLTLDDQAQLVLARNALP